MTADLGEIRRVFDCAELLYSESEVQAAFDRMAEQVRQRLEARNPLVICVLTGGVVTTAELTMRCDFPLTTDTVHATRYRGETSGGELDWISFPRASLEGRDVLVVDDILDQGLTLAAICEWCRDQGAASVYSAVLIDKRLPLKKPVRADFVGLECEDRYIFGFGMDYKGYWRNASGIYACTADSADGD